MPVNKKTALRNAPPIPGVCPDQGFAPFKGEAYDQVLPTRPPCGSTDIKGPFFSVVRQQCWTEPNEAIVSRSFFCKKCQYHKSEEFLVHRANDVHLLDSLGIVLKKPTRGRQ